MTGDEVVAALNERVDPVQETETSSPHEELVRKIQAGGLFWLGLDAEDMRSASDYPDYPFYSARTARLEKFKRARALFAKAARMGSLEASYRLGLMHELGVGGRASWREARRHYFFPACRGQRESIRALARMLTMQKHGDRLAPRHGSSRPGDQIRTNEAKARRLYRVAASGGDDAAAWHLGGWWGHLED
jgi:TPR repeat protein